MRIWIMTDRTTKKTKGGEMSAGYIVTEVPTQVLRCTSANYCNLPGFYRWEEQPSGNLKQVKFHKVLAHTLKTPLV